MMNEDEDQKYVNNKTRYSPALARRMMSRLQRITTSPVLLTSPSSADLPPLVGALFDPGVTSRCSGQEKRLSGTITPTTSTVSPVTPRRGRQLKPLLIRQGSEPQLSHRLFELKCSPSPPDHDNTLHYNGSTGFDSPRTMTSRTFNRSLESSPATHRRLSPSGTSPITVHESPFSMSSLSHSASNSPFTVRRGVTIRLRRPLCGTPDILPTFPGHETKRYSLPVSLTDSHLSRNEVSRQVGFENNVTFHSEQWLNCAGETVTKRTVDNEISESLPILRRRPHTGPEDESSSHSDHETSLDDEHACLVTNQNDMLYDIEETHDEIQEPNHNNNRLNIPDSVKNDVQKDLPDYQMAPLSAASRVTEWLQGLRPNEDNPEMDVSVSRPGKLLPHIGGVS